MDAVGFPSDDEGDDDTSERRRSSGGLGKPRSSTKLPPFISKVLLMLASPQVAPCMTWTSAGDAIQVKELATFASKVGTVP